MAPEYLGWNVGHIYLAQAPGRSAYYRGPAALLWTRSVGTFGPEESG